MNYYKYDGVWEEILIWVASIAASAITIAFATVTLMIMLRALTNNADSKDEKEKNSNRNSISSSKLDTKEDIQELETLQNAEVSDKLDQLVDKVERRIR